MIKQNEEYTRNIFNTKNPYYLKFKKHIKSLFSSQIDSIFVIEMTETLLYLELCGINNNNNNHGWQKNRLYTDGLLDVQKLDSEIANCLKSSLNFYIENNKKYNETFFEGKTLYKIIDNSQKLKRVLIKPRTYHSKNINSSLCFNKGLLNTISILTRKYNQHNIINNEK